MIFVKLNVDNTIGSIHYQPFNEKVGLGKTEEELRQEGLLVESLPQVEEIPGKQVTLKYNGTELYYEYENIPLTPEEKSQQEIQQLKTENETLLSAVTEMTEYIAAQDARLTVQENAITELSTLIAGGM